MAPVDYAFYEDQKPECKGKCYAEVLPLSSSDERFRRRSRSNEHGDVSKAAASTSIEHFSCSSSDSESIQSQSSSSVVEESQPSNQNRVEWTNFSRVCERYNLSDRAGDAVATCVLQDLGIVNEKDKSFSVDRSKL